MAKFYFTYGTDGQPFFGGWTEVEAPDAHAACAAFRAYHPDKTEGLVNSHTIRVKYIDPIGVKHLKEVVRNESKRRQRAQQRILAGGAA